MAKERIFIIESDTVYSQMLRDQLMLDENFELQFFSDIDSLQESLIINPFCIFFTLSLPNAGAAELARRVHAYNPDIQLILLCKPGEEFRCKEFRKDGVREHLVKDKDIKVSAGAIMVRLAYLSGLLRENSYLKERVFTEHSGQYSAQDSLYPEKTLQIFIRKAAGSRLPVLLRSVLGCQPEMVARLIHDSSSRSSAPFIAIDLRQIPKDHINNLLFKENDRRKNKAEYTTGIITAANKGTVFIDHFELLGKKMQEKLMNFFVMSSYRVRGKAKITANTRFIFSTYSNPEVLVADGKIDPDFYGYLKNSIYKITPLKERLSDIPAIAEEFLKTHCNEHHLKIKTLSPKAMTKLMAYSYPEDLSELKNILQRAVALSPNDIIRETAIQFIEGYYNPDFASGNKSPYEIKVQMVAHSLKLHNGRVAEVVKELKIGKSTIYRMRDRGLIHF